MNTLLLFDIDGTLLVTHGAGRRSIEATLTDLCRVPISTDGVQFSGKTDPLIMREIMAHNGLAEEDVERLLPDALARYERTAFEGLRSSDVRVLPGVTDILSYLAERPHVHLGLVTGNLERTAFLKLEAAGLDHYFSFGAFGSDHADRNLLPAVAVRRAREATGIAFGGPDVVIVGDTGSDIACGRTIGARCVAVCTGRFSATDLHAHRPDVLLDDLGDLDLFVRRVLSG